MMLMASTQPSKSTMNTTPRTYRRNEFYRASRSIWIESEVAVGPLAPACDPHATCRQGLACTIAACGMLSRRICGDAASAHLLEHKRLFSVIAANLRVADAHSLRERARQCTCCSLTCPCRAERTLHRAQHATKVHVNHRLADVLIKPTDVHAVYRWQRRQRCSALLGHLSSSSRYSRRQG